MYIRTSKRYKRSRKVAIAIISLLSGTLMGLAPAPRDIHFLAWVSLAPLWFFLRKKIGSVWLIASLWGTGYHGLSLWWLSQYPTQWLNLGLPNFLQSLILWLFVTLWGTALVVIWAIGLTLFSKYITKFKPIALVIIGVTFWCTLEIVWENTPLNWSYLAYTQAPNNLPILQLLKISGPTTVTAAIVAANGLLAESVLNWPISKKKKNNFRNLLASVISGFMILYLLGYITLITPIKKPESKSLEIGIVQGNTPHNYQSEEEEISLLIQRYTDAYKYLANQKNDAVLLPEAALPPKTLKSGQLYKFIKNYNVPAWIGTFGKSNGKRTNSLFELRGNGKITARYNKNKLVPLGEYIPSYKNITNIVSNISRIKYDIKTGSKKQKFESYVGMAIIGICYDSAFTKHFQEQAARGGKFILTISNDDLFGKAMPFQHHAHDVMRAIETDRWAARSTRTGISAIVDPKGRTKRISNLNSYDFFSGEIFKRETHTLYVLWGNWLIWILVGTSIVLFIANYQNN